MRAERLIKIAGIAPTCLALFSALPAASGSGAHPLFGAPPAVAPAPNAPPAASVRSVTPTVQLTPALTGSEENAGPAAVRWNAGEVEAWRLGAVEHTFVLKNATPHPISVSRLRGACGCETLILAKNGSVMPQTNLAPGESAQVKVSVALRGGQEGELHKFAWAYGPAPESPPLASMEIVLISRSAISFTPDSLDFGTLTIGAVRSFNVSVMVDADALAGQPIPVPTIVGSGVSVTPEGNETTSMRNGHPARTRRFQVTLVALGASGSVSGNLSVSVGPPAALASARLPLSGTIRGNLFAQPRTLFFGAMPAGVGGTREAALSRAAGDRGQALSATSGSPWLTAYVRTDPGVSPVLEVTLKPGAPVGIVQTEVLVTSASGERLSVPVVGEVLSAAH